MVAKPAIPASAKLIDFEQARSLHSRQRNSPPKQVNLAAAVLRQSEPDFAPPTTRVSGTPPFAVILAAIRNSESQLADRRSEVEQPVTYAFFGDFSLELRRIEERLGVIEGRINALNAPVPGNTIVFDNAIAARLQEELRAPSMLQTSNPLTVSGIEGRLSHVSGGEKPHRLQRQLTRLWNVLRACSGWIHAAGKPLQAKLMGAFPGEKSSYWPLNSPQIGGRRLGDSNHRLAVHLKVTRKHALACAGALVALGSALLLSNSNPIGKTHQLPVVDHLPGWRGPNAERVAGKNQTASPARVEVKINSLDATFDLLGSKPVSGGASSANIGLPPQADAHHNATPTPVVTDPADLATGKNQSTSDDAHTPPQGEPARLETLAMSGDSEAQYDYATELYKSGDTNGAVSWLEKAAKQSHAKAQLQLGNLFLNGNGVPRNFARARRWLETAANNGEPLAMHNLGVLYSGNEGRKPDYVRASEWFRRAAELGVVDSMFNLGLAYVDGLGVEKDDIQAYAWLSVAAAQGDAKAAQKRKQIGKILNRDELSEARTLANALKLAQRDR